MSNILIVHGAYGGPDEHWIPWIREKLENYGYNIIVPKFPDPQSHDLNSWLMVFNDYRKYLNENSIIIGHDIGSTFILHVLEGLKDKVKAVFLVSSFTGKPTHEKFKNINLEFTDKEFNWEKIKKSCRRFYLYHGNDDPYIPVENAINLAEQLDGNLNLIRNGGHLDQNSGYVMFELLLDEIKNELY
ncbi:MAG: alpha/beta hydrolase [Candidatus Nanoarchaeia archaeon]|nr:alpha/beta hydrolase [Candidatus Nanoarchaeia archaeon]